MAQPRKILKMNIGLNLGNQDCKNVSDNIKDSYSSLATYDYKNGMNKEDYKQDPNKILINDITCIVGIGNESYSDFKFRDDDEIKTLACFGVMRMLALKDNCEDIDIIELDLCVGLPISEYKNRENHQKLNNIFKGSLKVNYLNSSAEIRFNKLIIVPEGFAYYAAYKEEKEYDKYRKVLLLDFGSRTIDSVDIINGTALKPTSTPDIGTIHLMDKMREEGINLENVEIDEILKTGSYRVGNIEYHKADYNKIIQRYAKSAHQKITQLYGDLSSFQKIIIFGGGAYLVGEIFLEYYPGIVEIVEDPVFANARAYYQLSYLPE